MKKKLKRPLHVVVGVPSMGLWTSDTAKAVALMFSDWALNMPKRDRLTLIGVEGSMICTQREMMIKKVLQSDATHILFIDSDMRFPFTVARRLVGYDLPFIAANCTTREFPPQPVAHGLDGERTSAKGKEGLEEVQHVGLAVALIKTEYIKRLRPPLFLMDWVPSMNSYCGEDVYFTQKLREIGVKIMVDNTLSQQIQHVGRYRYGYDDIDAKVVRKMEVA